MKTKKLVLCGLFSALIIIGAFIKIPFPGVPMTLQFTFVLLSGIILGPYWGALSAAIYMMLGLIGIPVFTSGGGFGYVLTPSFGYILGFIAAAFAAGLISRTGSGKFSRFFLASIAAVVITYFMGVGYFILIKSFYLGEDVSFRYVMYSQVLLMLPKDILMCVLCAFIGKKLHFTVKL